MFNDVTIMIPSSGRAQRQITLAQLPPIISPRVKLAIPQRELADYAVHHPTSLLHAVPDKFVGISGTRRFLMDTCPTRYLLMIDDDMTFAFRPNMQQAALKSLPPQSHGIVNLLMYWRGLMREYAHVGLSARQGNNRVEESVKECCRMFNTYMYDLERVRGLGVEVGRLPVMEDFDLTLQLLRKGCPNAVIYRWCWNQSGSNAPGGCSQYRTTAMQAEAASKLAELHPGFVKIVQKESKNWQGMHQRMDVTIYWKKAYESSVR